MDPAEQNNTTHWNHIRKLLERKSPFSHGFEGDPQLLKGIHDCKILVVGAGGLGCEILKNLSLLGFKNIEVIDMDTIDLSNLNRQFLFRLTDIGNSKAQIAANFIKSRLGIDVKAHFMKIQDKGQDFYKQFKIIVCGLDSPEARRWLNEKVVALVKYETAEDGSMVPDDDTIIPIVDGGTEGFQGSVRVIIPTITPCLNCTLGLYPPQTAYLTCTIANKPRLPEHCIEYVRLNWGKHKPFGPEVHLDGDDPAHINWIFGKALERANEFNITGVTYRLTQGVVKNIIPAVASTNAIIAAACSTEVLKLVTDCSPWMHNFSNFQNHEGIYTVVQNIRKDEDCMVCSTKPIQLDFPPEITLEGVLKYLEEDEGYNFVRPVVTGLINGLHKTLFMKCLAGTRPNLQKTLKELGISHGGEINVNDKGLEKELVFEINYRKSPTTN